MDVFGSMFWMIILLENGSHDQKRIGRIWRHGILKNDFTLKPGYDSLNPPQRTHAKTRVHPQNMVFPLLLSILHCWSRNECLGNDEFMYPIRTKQLHLLSLLQMLVG
ncbi:hypothetical protein TNIN_493301 [Trichonephila inaurata madagascariensis]|uniref:Uncharacterized protein n=1 Tax=Trichonephila inaurata madagascariensis TaxID=2747483 RepID=A0A8X7CEZ3_9ARAC|nr:hypothetical protein TNIN_259101 [Trichonephila inaurata madagascariensis]GFY63620.1 hypothetical protein TNIN_493301 [Trichonephila inaurata madagascariensis]